MKKNLSPEKQATRNKLIILAGLIFILAGAAYLFLTYEPKSVAQSFYENRKSVNSYNEYKDQESSKRKSERNIFLQD